METKYQTCVLLCLCNTAELTGIQKLQHKHKVCVQHREYLEFMRTSDIQLLPPTNDNIDANLTIVLKYTEMFYAMKHEEIIQIIQHPPHVYGQEFKTACFCDFIVLRDIDVKHVIKKKHKDYLKFLQTLSNPYDLSLKEISDLYIRHKMDRCEKFVRSALPVQRRDIISDIDNVKTKQKRSVKSTKHKPIAKPTDTIVTKTKKQKRSQKEDKFDSKIIVTEKLNFESTDENAYERLPSFSTFKNQ